MNKFEWTRRAFLAAATTASTVAFTGIHRVNAAQVVPRKISPNEKINIAGIGVGGKGFDDIMSCRRENIVALCDPDEERAGEAHYRVKDAKHYKDYRKMLDEMGDQIDACTISTPDHTHAPAAYLAMNLGKHVYVQKPMAHTVAEIRLLTKTAAEKGVITQMGNQGHCGDGVRELCEMLWSGVIGKVTEAHIWTNRPIWAQGMAENPPEQPVPPTLDWDLWIGSAPMRPYNKAYVPWVWRGWWDFGCGAIGDMACHIMDPAFWSLKLYEAQSYSVEVVNQEGMTAVSPPLKSVIKYEFPARGDMAPVTVYWHDGGNQPARPKAFPQTRNSAMATTGRCLSARMDSLPPANMAARRVCCRMRRWPTTRSRNRPFPHPRETPTCDCAGASVYGQKSVSDFSYAGPIVANMGNVASALSGKEAGNGCEGTQDHQ